MTSTTNTTQPRRKEELASSSIRLPLLTAATVKKTADNVNRTHPTNISAQDVDELIGPNKSRSFRASDVGRPPTLDQYVANDTSPLTPLVPDPQQTQHRIERLSTDSDRTIVGNPGGRSVRSCLRRRHRLR